MHRPIAIDRRDDRNEPVGDERRYGGLAVAFRARASDAAQWRARDKALPCAASNRDEQHRYGGESIAFGIRMPEARPAA